MDIYNIRTQFPILSEKVYGKPLVYLDNAATSQRPQSVIDKWVEVSAIKNSNLHRAVHKLAAEATESFECARDAVKEFISAGSREEIIFTSGATEALNLVARSFGEKFLGEGDEVIIAESEHHSNIVPWQMICEKQGAHIKVLPVDENGRLEIEKLPEILSERSKILCVAHISNVLGLVNPIKEIVNICHSRRCAVLVDGAQGVVHEKVNVRELGCDFYAFSGHKMYAAPGTGVLYGRKELLEQMPPFLGGGEMIGTVTWAKTSYAPLPQKFEAGTQNISSVPTLIQAIQVLEQMRSAEMIEYQENVKNHILNTLLNDSRIRLFGVPRGTEEKTALFSFTVDGVHHEDLALVLDKMGIAVRSGQMCAEPLMDRYGVTGMLRASFAPYNTMEEAEYFIKSLDRAIQMLL